MPLQSEMQGLRTLQQQEGIKRRQASSGIAQPLHSRLDDEGEIAECLGVGDAVVGRIGLDKAAEASGGFPVELAAVHDDAADGIAVAANKLRSGVDDDVSAPIYGPAERGGRTGVVDHQRHTVLMRDLGQLLDVNDVKFGITNGFGVDSSRLLVYGGAQPVEVVGIHKLY